MKPLTYIVILYSLFLTIFRRLPVLEETAADISKLTGNKVLPVQCDIRDPAAIKSAVDACVTEFGLPHVIVHNAAGNILKVA